MKKAYLVIAVIGLIACLTGLPYMVEGIAQRGVTGVNYGRVLFPLLIAGLSFHKFRIQ